MTQRFVYAGTSSSNEPLKPGDGKRRYWPVSVGAEHAWPESIKLFSDAQPLGMSASMAALRATK